MHLDFLQDLALVMIVAAVVTVVFQKLRQPVVLGYIVAGVIVGPHTSIPLFVHDQHTVQIMSELGVILLMFGLGLHFSLRKLANVGATALIAAVLEIVVMVALGYLTGRAFGWEQMDSLFLGAILSISSTTIIIKALQELGLTKERFANLIFGILIVEDILAIAMLALLSGLASRKSLPLGEVTGTLARLGVFLTSVLVVGLLFVPWLLRQVNRLRSNETLLIAALGLCFGVSLLAMRLGYSVALGAFLIGAVIAEARERGKIETLIEPVKDMFSAVFFVAIGMLIDPAMLLKHWLPIVVITVVVVVGKVIACATGTLIAGHDGRTSLRVGMGLAQIGEFSFIIAQLGLTLKVTSDFLYPIAVTVSAITTLLTPYLIRLSDPLAARIHPLIPRPLVSHAAIYTAWASRVGKDTSRSRFRRVVRKLALQILLNMVLVSAIFITAGWTARHWGYQWTWIPAWAGGPNALLWLAAMLLSLPIIIVDVRKVRAMAMILAEAGVTRTSTPQQTEARRALVGGTLRWLAVTALALLLLALSAAIMPPWPILAVLAAAIIVAGALRWRSLERIYGRAQSSIVETVTTDYDHEPPEAAPLPGVLRDALLKTVEIADASQARGRLIRELQLRSLTGASAVGIDRAGQSIINPGPDEELQAGDKVLLLGNQNQLSAAATLLTRPA